MDFSKLMQRFSQGLRPEKNTQEADWTFEEYDSRLPHWQNAVDLVPGWSSSFPAQKGVKAGKLALFSDPRIAWAIGRFGELKGKDILEIGPLEGMHTFMLNQHAPRKIDAVEANRLCYVRCLVTDQIMKIDRANFLLGDALEWLEHYEGRYDLVVASGVLYHMSDPVRFLELAASRTDALFLWTHYFTPEAMPQGDVRRRPFTGKEEVKTVRGQKLRLYERNYHRASNDSAFCGGPKDRHYWMHKQDILDFLKALGLSSIEIDADNESHAGGPCFCVLARRA